MKIYAAPLQGLNDAPWRHLHADVCGGVDTYFMPFLRVEHGSVRAKELRDLTSELNRGIDVVPQAIFRSVDELALIAEAVRSAGFSRLDLNLGCPFPPQLHRGRGAAMVSRPEIMERVAEVTEGLELSVKMRPGVNSPDEWRAILPVLNSLDLHHVTVHPRLASQGYSGPILTDCFREMADAISHPIVYNGDVLTPSQIDRLHHINIYGVMIGRGLIGRPSLAAEWREGADWPLSRRVAAFREILGGLASHFAATMSGGPQALLHLKPYAEYPDPELPARALKPLRKASSLARFMAALTEIR